MPHTATKQVKTAPFKPSSTAKPEIYRYVMDFSNIAKGGVEEFLIETGINSTAPAIMVVQSLDLHINRGQADLKHMGWLARETGQVLAEEVEGEFNVYTPSNAIAVCETTARVNHNQQYPIKGSIDPQAPIYEEEIYLGVGLGLLDDGEAATISTYGMSGQLILTMAKYKVTNKVWLDTANANTTGNRFI